MPFISKKKRRTSRWIGGRYLRNSGHGQIPLLLLFLFISVVTAFGSSSAEPIPAPDRSTSTEGKVSKPCDSGIEAVENCEPDGAGMNTTRIDLAPNTVRRARDRRPPDGKSKGIRVNVGEVARESRMKNVVVTSVSGQTGDRVTTIQETSGEITKVKRESISVNVRQVKRSVDRFSAPSKTSGEAYHEGTSGLDKRDGRSVRPVVSATALAHRTPQDVQRRHAIKQKDSEDAGVLSDSVRQRSRNLKIRDALAQLPAFDRDPVPNKAGDETSQTLRTDWSLLTERLVFPVSRDDVPGPLRDRVSQAVRTALQNPDMGFALLASLSERWNSPAQSEYLFSRVLEVCKEISQGRGLEVWVATFRSFAQKLNNEELHRRAQLRIGRLYYEQGQFEKAVVELAVDPEMNAPTSFDTLAGLIKAVSLIRLKNPRKALSLLEWVFEKSTEASQQARAAFLLGKLNLLYGDRDGAKRWLQKVAYELPDESHASEARLLLQGLM